MSKTKMTTENFVEKATAKHGGKYDYSNTVFVDWKTKVVIKCPVHGEFPQDPRSHLSGCGCPDCYAERRGKNRKDSMDTKEFVRRAREVHGDLYSYDKTVYVNASTPVIITCKIHGDFTQLPNNHLKGHGCKQCAASLVGEVNKVKKTGVTPSNKVYNEDIVRKAMEIHGDKFSYEKTDYSYARQQITVTCNCCGRDFKVYSTKLLKPDFKCPLCEKDRKAEEYRKKAELQFIAEATEKHGGKYDYSEVKYVNRHTPVTIICPEHGPFPQTPAKHLAGQGCKKCSRPNEGVTKEEFIEKANAKHGNRYDYSKVIYKNATTPVEIVCHEKDILGREHGSFFQTPHEHLSGKGCAKCAGKFMDTELFVAKANLVHNNKYDYSKAVYVNTNTPVTIICPVHGEFTQTPSDHLSGRGCENCYRLQKPYKFKLINEFESEFNFRAFLANNDVNILQLILGSLCELEPKYAPLERDIQRALANASSTDPIEALEQKYSTESESDSEGTATEEETTAPETPQPTTTIDLDNDNDVYAALAAATEENGEEQSEPSIEDVIRNDEQEIQVINRIEHMLTPEIRLKIMKKYLNDKRRAWMMSRENNTK